MKKIKNFLIKYTPQQWVTVMKALFNHYVLGVNPKDKEIIDKANTYNVEYQDRNLWKISLKINELSKTDIKIELSIFSIDFLKPIGGGQWEIFNKIPIQVLTILNYI